ncbi:RNA-guided endonuclease InsQ/TnpB family protein [Nostoc sp.]|uniref:RNA-guided endonuclease InsQ/TnpB family protein n=1 Tax=Nostoc sp. TaxID=1180 RepID=UPI002FF839F1
MKSFKTQLDLNNKQSYLCARHAGTSRHAYNWGLALLKELLNHNKANPTDKIKFPTAIDLHKLLVASVKAANPWYYEVSKCAPQEALKNLIKAFKRMHQVKGSGFPKFKKKNIRDSFYLEGSIKINGDKIKLPILGWVKCHEKLPGVSPKNVTISKRAGKWFVAFKLDTTPINNQLLGEPVGVDLGINVLATCSNGFVAPNPKAYRKSKRKLAKLQKELCRRTKGGKNRDQTKLKLAKCHYRISNIRSDNLHKLTTYLAKNHSEVWVEDLNISGMLKNHKLASAISDCGFSEFKRQLEYKTVWYGSKLCLVDRWFPSSQLCSGCDAKQSMPLNQRVYECFACNLSIDRDLNASRNILNYARIAQSCKSSDGSSLPCSKLETELQDSQSRIE